MTHEMEIDGIEIAFTEGETVLEVAQRIPQTEIPTLCYDPRLEPFGGCRLCIVELEGARNPAASCTTKATEGMVVRTATDTIEAYRKTLLEMVVSENREVDVSPLRGYASGELADLRDRYDVNGTSITGATSGTSKVDENPFILRDYELCISCYRCVRVCAEQEGDHAINVMNRGFDTQITTEFDGRLKDSACTFCGQCIQTCPTGALADKKALRAVDEVADAVPEKTRTICPYCGVGCSVDVLTKNEKIVGIHPAMDGPANQGALCVKGQFAYDFVQHPDRLKTPLIRDDDGELHEASWEEALDRVAEGFRKVHAEHGRHGIYGIASGRAPSEAAYLMQKFIRAGFGTNYIDNCSRA
jgi:predicted molibdopterin-dependent oxidoreductase YjgC